MEHFQVGLPGGGVHFFALPAHLVSTLRAIVFSIQRTIILENMVFVGCNVVIACQLVIGIGEMATIGEKFRNYSYNFGFS
jgi:hypothetical protein